jgi:hypothetical protein
MIAMMASAGLALVGFSGATATPDDGLDSTVDYALKISGAGVSGTYAAKAASDTYPAVSSTATFEAWINPSGQPTYGGTLLSKDESFVFSVFPSREFNWAFHDGSNWFGWYGTGIYAQTNAWQHVAFVKNGTTLEFPTTPRALLATGTLMSSQLSQASLTDLQVTKICNFHQPGKELMSNKSPQPQMATH